MDIAGALEGCSSQAAHAGRCRITLGSVGRGSQAGAGLFLPGRAGSDVLARPGGMVGRLAAISGWAASWVLFGIR
jgi:hypothetical protein